MIDNESDNELTATINLGGQHGGSQKLVYQWGIRGVSAVYQWGIKWVSGVSEARSKNFVLSNHLFA